jgi:hypothetical protein
VHGAYRRLVLRLFPYSLYYQPLTEVLPPRCSDFIFVLPD